MTEKEIHNKILQINKNFDFVASCIKFYKQEFENLEDELEYCGKYSWLPDHKEKVKEILHKMKEIVRRTELEEKHFDALEKQLDEIEDNL
jgi:chromosome segregation ATPase